MKQWQLQEAKAGMSELIKLSKTVAVVLSRQTYDYLTGQSQSLLDFMQQSPLADFEDLEFERNKSSG